MENRLDRELDTKEKKVNKPAWKRPELLPDPTPQDGWTFHWVRVSTNGQPDPTNVSSKLREDGSHAKPQITLRFSW